MINPKQLIIQIFIIAAFFIIYSCSLQPGGGGGGSPDPTAGNGMDSQITQLCVWLPGSVEKKGQTNWYYFDEAPGVRYYVNKDDSYYGSGLCTANIQVDIYINSKSSYSYFDVSYPPTHSSLYNATETRRIYMSVTGKSTGTYALMVQTNNPEFNPYNVSIDSNDNFLEAITLNYCTLYTSQFDYLGDADYYKFYAAGGNLYTIETFPVSNVNIDTVINIYDSNFVLVGNNNDKALSSQFILNCKNTGTYYIKVWENNNNHLGNYSISVVTNNIVGDYPAGYPTIGRTWTVMVYLDAANNLESYGLADFEEMESGLYGAINYSGNKDIMNNLNIIVLFDRIDGWCGSLTETHGVDWTDTRLYRVLPDNNSSYFYSERLDDNGPESTHIAPIGEKNMGDPATLDWFIKYCKNNFTATNYALIFWNHGGGTRSMPDAGGQNNAALKAVCWDNESSDVLYIDEIQQAVTNNFSSSSKLGLMGFDACYMGMVEVGYEFRDCVQYLAASMNTEPGEGWNYFYLFYQMFGARDESLITPRDFASLIVESYKTDIELNSPGCGFTMAAADLSQMNSLKTAIDNLAVSINAENQKSAIETVRDASVHFYSSDEASVDDPFTDIYDFCSRLTNSAGFSEGLKNSAAAVIDALASAVVYAYGSSGNGQSYYYGAGSDVRRGLSIFFSRGNLIYNGYSHYYYQWWYTDRDTQAWRPGENYYGRIDFCDSDGDGTVESWRELMEKWYDPFNTMTPGTY